MQDRVSAVWFERWTVLRTARRSRDAHEEALELEDWTKLSAAKRLAYDWAEDHNQDE